jgi:hypothetical protein
VRTIADTVRAVAEAAEANFSRGLRYVTVIVDDHDEPTHVSAHGTREKAQRIANLHAGWHRGYVAVRDTRGDTVVLTGPVVVGTHPSTP